MILYLIEKYSIKKICSIILITYLIMSNLQKWIKDSQDEIKEIIELKEFIRNLDTYTEDTLDNRLLKSLSLINTNKKLKIIIKQMASEIQNQTELTLEELWQKNFQELLEKYKLNTSINENIMTLANFLNTCELEIKREKIKCIVEDLNETIKEKEERFNRLKGYKIKERIILNLLLILIIL